MGNEERFPLGWGDRMVPLHTTVSFYYANETTLDRALSFIRAGLDEPGTFCVAVAGPGYDRTLLEQLQHAYRGEVQAMLDAGKLDVVTDLSSFEAVATAMVERMDNALSHGFQRIRALGLVAWGQPDWLDLAALKRCEEAANMVAASYPAMIVCVYNVPQLVGEALQEAQEDPTTFIEELGIVREPPSTT
jgi:hypothetical protein